MSNKEKNIDTILSACIKMEPNSEEYANKDDMIRKINSTLDIKMFHIKDLRDNEDKFIVGVISKIIEGKTILIPYEEMDINSDNNINKIIKRINRIAHIERYEFTKLLDSALDLKLKKKISKDCPEKLLYTDSLEGCNYNSEGREYYNKVMRMYHNNLNLFAYKSKDNFDPKDHIGCIMDDEDSIRKYGGYYIAFISTELSRILNDKYLEENTNEDDDSLAYKEYNRLKQKMINSGYIRWSKEDGRRKIILKSGGAQVQCVLIKSNSLGGRI